MNHPQYMAYQSFLPKKTKQLVETVREIGSSLPSEARNVFLRTPEGLETPHFHLLYEGDGVRWRLALVD